MPRNLRSELERLRRHREQLEENDRRRNNTVVAPETVHALDALAQIRREGTWDPHDVGSWDWMTRQDLEEHLRDLLIEKGVGRGLAENMGAQIAGNVIEKHARKSTARRHDGEEE